jgi:hypothetical protein
LNVDQNPALNAQKRGIDDRFLNAKEKKGIATNENLRREPKQPGEVSQKRSLQTQKDSLDFSRKEKQTSKHSKRRTKAGPNEDVASQDGST